YRLAGSITSHTARHEGVVGYEASAYSINYNASSAQAETQFFNLKQAPTSGAIYVDDIWRITPSWMLETGVRAEGLTGRRWVAVSPRVSAKYFVSPDWAVTAAVGRFSQWMHSLAR